MGVVTGDVQNINARPWAHGAGYIKSAGCQVFYGNIKSVNLDTGNTDKPHSSRNRCLLRHYAPGGAKWQNKDAFSLGGGIMELSFAVITGRTMIDFLKGL